MADLAQTLLEGLPDRSTSILAEQVGGVVQVGQLPLREADADSWHVYLV